MYGYQVENSIEGKHGYLIYFLKGYIDLLIIIIIINYIFIWAYMCPPIYTQINIPKIKKEVLIIKKRHNYICKSIKKKCHLLNKNTTPFPHITKLHA